MNTSSSRSKAKTLATVLLLGMLAGCAGGSKSSSCTNCVPPVKPEFLYATALNQIALFNVDTTDGTLTLPLGANAGTFPGPNDAEGLVADPQARFLFVSDFTGSLVRVFNIDTSNGSLTEVTGSPFPLDASGPRGLVTDVGGKFLFVADFNSNEISVFKHRLKRCTHAGDGLTLFCGWRIKSCIPASASVGEFLVHQQPQFS